jgi:serine/threonine protein kinase/uncharacterized caspase-like protein
VSSEQSIHNRIALIVGIDNYPSQPLRVCTHDAIEMAAAMSMPEYGFSVTTLLNADCTRKNLRQKLEALFRGSAEVFLFYFSGHGWATDLGVYLVTIDSDSDEEGVDLDYVTRLITKLVPAESTAVVILDCCHSGAALPRGRSAAGVDIRSQDVSSAVPALARGRVVLAACRGDQLAYEDSKIGHGIFTSYVLQGLLGEAADCDGMITVTGLYDYVSRTFVKSGLQTPVFRGDIAGRLILGEGFIPRAAPILNEERAVEIEREAERHLREYQARVASSFGNLDQWKAEGHKVACQMLEPVLNWFEKQAQQAPPLRLRQKFVELESTAIQRLATLCGLDVGTMTSHGIIRERLGSGTFGTVWRLENTGVGRPLAFKNYHAQDLHLSEKVRRFSRGYSAMKQLDHPYIVKVEQFTECPLGFYMDFIEGPNLRNFSGTLEDPQSNVEILLIVAETLRHAHRRGVVHRDVKPENIIMKFDPDKIQWAPFLTDFDLAWFSTASQVFTKEGMGSVYYASPEQYATPSAASAHAPTTDIYSFGQLCFFVSTGSDPVPLGVADNIRALKSRLGNGWFSDAAETFLALYEDCTEHKPDKRPQNFGDICDRLFRIKQSLSAISVSTSLLPDQFIREVVFSMVGLVSENITEGSFLSMSKKTRVAVEIRHTYDHSAEVSFEFHSQDRPVIEGVNTFEQLRKILLGRIEAVVSAYPNTRKRYGTNAPFQVFIECEQLPLDLNGVATSRALTARILDALEGR